MKSVIFSTLILLTLFSCTKESIDKNDNAPVIEKSIIIVPAFEFSVASSATLTNKITIKSDTTISGSVEWGDGTKTNFLGTYSVSVSYNYAVAGNYNAKVYIKTHLTDITSVDGSIGEITSVSGLSNMPNLKVINFHHNKLTSINVSGLKNLKELTVYHNDITGFDLSTNDSLFQLSASENKITDLNLSNNHNLFSLSVPTNLITSIDLSGNNKLNKVSVEKNKLSVSSINEMVKTLDGFGNSYGRFASIYQSPVAAPSGSGITAIQSLTAKHWVVTTD